MNVISVSFLMTVQSPQWAWSQSRELFLHFGARGYISEADEAIHFKFDMQILPGLFTDTDRPTSERIRFVLLLTF